MADVFISYSSKDDTLVRFILKRLEAHGIDFWFAKNPGEIGGGEDYADRIVEAIQSCKVLIFMTTRHSVNSKETLREVHIASSLKKLVVPLVLERDIRLPGGFLYRLALSQKIFADDLNSDWFERLKLTLGEVGIVVRQAAQDAMMPIERPRRRSVTAMLPYLANRHTVIGLVEHQIENHLLTNAQRPIMFISHGEEGQRCDRLVQRLIEDALPRHFQRLSRPDNFERQNIRWPDVRHDEDGSNVGARFDAYRREVARRLNLPTNSDVSAMADRIGKQRQPVILYSLIGARDWPPNESILLDTVAKFWSGFPDIPTMSQPLIVLIGVSYKEQPNSIWSNLFGNKRNAGVPGQLRLLRSDFSQALNHIVLPGLVSLERKDVEDWVRDELRSDQEDEILRFVGALFDGDSSQAEDVLTELIDSSDLERVMKHVRSVVALKANRVPMEPLAPILKQLGKSHETLSTIL